jgi:hypothetical protein
MLAGVSRRYSGQKMLCAMLQFVGARAGNNENCDFGNYFARFFGSDTLERRTQKIATAMYRRAYVWFDV